MLLNENLNIILVHPRFPENIGMAARTCANMGCNELCLVRPKRWNLKKMEALATAKGKTILDNIKFFPTLSAALHSRNLAIATTARTGGWRKNILSPAQTAEKIHNALQDGLKVSLVFGPEDQGLDNSEIILCQEIAHIITPGDANSLNLAQAVLLMLYECCQNRNDQITIDRMPKNERISLGDFARLEQEFKDILTIIGCQQGKIPDYFFIQWQHILYRGITRRHEYDAFMGFCRQIKNNFSRNKNHGQNAHE